MFSDILEAEKKYNDLYIPEWEARKVKNFEDQIAFCGLDCKSCEARKATVENDSELRKTRNDSQI